MQDSFWHEKSLFSKKRMLLHFDLEKVVVLKKSGLCHANELDLQITVLELPKTILSKQNLSLFDSLNLSINRHKACSKNQLQLVQRMLKIWF